MGFYVFNAQQKIEGLNSGSLCFSVSKTSATAHIIRFLLAFRSVVSARQKTHSLVYQIIVLQRKNYNVENAIAMIMFAQRK